MADNGTQEKALVDDRVLERSVQKQPDYQTIPGSDTFVINISSFADDLPAWGRQIRQRDLKLREFWPTEPLIAGAIQTIVAARSNMSWSLDGPPRTVGILQRMLQASNLGRGWLDLQIKVCTDVLTQDNGAFVEVVRKEDAPNSPFVNLNHLDAGKCIRTGMADIPVIYYDRQNVEHKMKWYQILTFEDMPSPIERMNGLQVCFLSRILRAAQIIKDFGIYKREKIAGRNPGQIHLVSGVQTKLVEDKLQDSQHSADNQGYTRFMLPVVIGSLDPNANVNATTIDLRSVPDGFDEDTTLRWYIAQIAMAAGADYQDFAPLSSGNIGTSTQSEVLDRKSRGKGQETWRKLWEHKLNFHGILPQSVTFAFDEKDIEGDQQQAKLNDTKAKTYSTYYDKGQGVLPLNVIHQMMADDGILTPEYLALIGATDATSDIVATDDEQAPTESEIQDSADVAATQGAITQPDEIPAEVREFKDSKNDINYGCLMLMMPISIKSLAMQIASQIDPDDLMDDGIENDTHVTVKYGFMPEVTPEQITTSIQGMSDPVVKIGNLSLFENDEFDVLKIDVDGLKLRQMNAVVSQLPNSDTHPQYNPHLTIAYLKPGMGGRYLDLDNPLAGIKTTGNLVYSDASKTTTPIQGSVKKKTQQKQFDTTDYQDKIAQLMRQIGNGDITEAQFIQRMESMVSDEITRAYLDASGKMALTADDLSIIEAKIAQNFESIPGLMDSVDLWLVEEVDDLTERINERVKLWGNDVEGVWNQGFLRGGDDEQPVAWRLGAADHCISCSTLANLVATRKEWRDSGWYPKSSRLACGGWRCGCSFEETDEPLTGIPV